MDVKSATQAHTGIVSTAIARNSAVKDQKDVGIKISAAYAVEINSTKVMSTTSTVVEKTKGLNADQVATLKDGIAASQALMIKVLMANNAKLQGYLSNMTGKLNFDGVLIDTSRFALPEVATTPEDAQKAISEGGAYSVSAVSDRVFGMAAEIANGDPEKLEAMRAAVEEGFRQAGLEFNSATGASGLPQICSDTHDEIMKRFDNLKAQLADTSVAAES